MKSNKVVSTIMIILVGCNLIVGYQLLKPRGMRTNGTYKILDTSGFSPNQIVNLTLAISKDHEVNLYDNNNTRLIEGKLVKTGVVESSDYRNERSYYYVRNHDGVIYYFSFYDGYASFNYVVPSTNEIITVHLPKVSDIPVSTIDQP